jgi:hypothetical protein
MTATGQSTDALGPGESQVLDSLPATWTNYAMSWTCSDPSDASARAWILGSADGTTFFPLRNFDGFPAAQTGTGVQFFQHQPVNALQAFVACADGNTVTVTVAGD